MRLVSRMGFGRAFNGFWEDFEMILAGFWGNMAEACQVAQLTLMIRAMRGRSMDGWMDGWIDAWMDG